MHHGEIFPLNLDHGIPCILGFIGGQSLVFGRACGLTLKKDADYELHILDSTTAKAHQHSAGAQAKSGPNHIAKSRGGNGTKIHAIVDALGYPVDFMLTGANVHDSVPAADFLSGKKADSFIGDKAYDSDAIRTVLEENGTRAIIPSHGRRCKVFDFDKHMYKERHLVECFFQKIKNWRRVATRYEKTAKMFEGMVQIACILIWLIF